MRGDPAAARFAAMRSGYESHYLRAVAPGGGLGVWLRHTVHVEPGEPPLASTWFTLFDAEAPGPVTAKQTVEGPPTNDPHWVGVAGSTLGPTHATGSITPAPGQVHPHLPVSWDLTFLGEPALEHLPSPWMYAVPIPRTKPVSLHPSARFTGTVTVGDRAVDVDGWKGMVGHNWGSEHAERWIWLHGLGFDGEPSSTWIDVVLGRLRVGGRTTPWVANGMLSVVGERRRLGGTAHTRATRVEERRDGAHLRLPGRGGLVVDLEVVAPPERCVAWLYAEPGRPPRGPADTGDTGDTADTGDHGHPGAAAHRATAHHLDHAVTNCSIADLVMTVTQPGGRRHVLTSAGQAAYEIGTRERPADVPLQPWPDGAAARPTGG
ncbi:hypothetical protein UB45_21595 [Terrabacter sp. 28]|jgi:hypothetical protein|nr:hypothetical protein UB45_21595 [Terrabacter sp. 28]